MNTLRKLFAVSAAVMLLGAGCGAPKPETSPEPSALKQQGPLTLTSPAFTDGQPIPIKYTCQGQDFSPPVVFTNAPPNAISLALIMEDTDASFAHWILYNISPGQGGIAEGDIPPGSAGTTTGGKLGYEGPCPQDDKTHHYTLSLYALKGVVDLQDGSSEDEVRALIESQKIAESKLTGTYAKQ